MPYRTPLGATLDGTLFVALIVPLVPANGKPVPAEVLVAPDGANRFHPLLVFVVVEAVTVVCADPLELAPLVPVTC